MQHARVIHGSEMTDRYVLFEVVSELIHGLMYVVFEADPISELYLPTHKSCRFADYATSSGTAERLLILIRTDLLQPSPDSPVSIASRCPGILRIFRNIESPK